MDSKGKILSAAFKIFVNIGNGIGLKSIHKAKPSLMGYA